MKAPNRTQVIDHGLATGFALLGIMVIFIASGWLGIDFGLHWDEHWMVEAWVETVETARYRSPRPYPGLYYDLSLPALGWVALSSADSAELKARVASEDFLIGMRMQFVLLAACAIWVTFLGLRRWRWSRGEALLAAAVVGFSWQFSYHSRWVASDALLALLVPAATFVALTGLRSEHAARAWKIGAVLAGSATAAKYPGGLALLPVLWMAARAPSLPTGWQPRAGRMLAAILLFSITFLVLSPHVWLNAQQAMADLKGMMDQYATGHLGHTIEPGLPHLSAMTVYMASALSPNPWLGWLLAALAGLGLVTLVVEREEGRWVFVIVPILYMGYFATQRVMLVRNLLVLIPFAAALVAIGAGFLGRAIPNRSIRVAYAGALVVICGFNAVWMTRSALTISDYSLRKSLVRLAEVIEQEPHREFVVSRQIYTRFQMSGFPRTTNWQVAAPDGSIKPGSRVAVLAYQYPVILFPWPANVRGRYQDLGPREVDWDYYPGWMAQDRAIVMSSSVWNEVRKPLTPEAG